VAAVLSIDGACLRCWRVAHIVVPRTLVECLSLAARQDKGQCSSQQPDQERTICLVMIDDLNSFGVRREGVARAAYLGRSRRYVYRARE
jgi:hypothetical protein